MLVMTGNDSKQIALPYYCCLLNGQRDISCKTNKARNCLYATVRTYLPQSFQTSLGLAQGPADVNPDPRVAGQGIIMHNCFYNILLF